MNTELNTHNNTRLIEVDVAKAFAIIYMVVDHVYERMSVVDSVATLPDSALRNIIEFAGGPLMALKAMGVDADYGYSVLDTFFLVDIFQLAGLSFLLMGLLKKAHMYSFLFTLSVVLIALALSYLVFHGREHTTIGRFIIYCSVNLTTIYVIQWLLIIYGFLFMMIIGSELISLEAVIPVGLIITAASIGLSVLWNKMERAAVGTS